MFNLGDTETFLIDQIFDLYINRYWRILDSLIFLTNHSDYSIFNKCYFILYSYHIILYFLLL